MIPDIDQKNVLFITTKNLDYIRNVQEIEMIRRQAASYKIIGSYSKHYFFRLLKVFLFLCFTSSLKFDTVFLGFAPQFVLPLFHKKFKNNYIVIDFFISFYDTLCYDRKKVRPDSPAGHFLHFIDQTTLCCADFIVCDTAAHGKYFTDEFQVPPGRLFPLYLQADASIYYPVPVKKPSHLQNKYVVLYFGSILPLQGADIVLQAMYLLKEQTNIFFYFIGPIKEKAKKELCPDSGNIEFIEWLNQQQLAELIGQADLCLAGHFNGSIGKARRTIPGKAFIYRAMQKPMILGDNPANHELFAQDNDTVFVEMGNVDALADAILTFYQNSKQPSL